MQVNYRKRYHYPTFHIDLNQMPFEHDGSYSRGLGIFALIFGLFCTFLPGAIFLSELHKFSLSLSSLGGIALLSAFFMAGLALLAFAVHAFTSKYIITYHKNSIILDTTTLLSGHKTRTLAYQEFKGVLMGERIIRQKDRPDIILQTIDLIHEDKSLNLNLYSAEGKTPPREFWKQYISYWRIPGLQKDGAGYQTVAHDDLNLSFQERSKRGYGLQQDPSFSAQDTPEELEISKQNGREGNQIRLRILKNRFSLPVLAFLFLFPIAFIAIPFFDNNVPFIFPLVGAFFLFLVVGMAWKDHNNKREIKITRSDIEIIDAQPQGKHKRTVKKLPLHSIENILIKGDNLNEHIMIIGKDGEISTGSGMSMDTLKWLQTYLRAAVATA